MNNQLTGQKAEQLASDYLESKGYTIMARNHRVGKAEIDLIARKDKWLVFVEVKFRSSNKFGHPEEAVSSRKMELYAQAAEEFTRDIPADAFWLRFDVLSVSPGHEGFQVTHFEDAFG